MSTTTLNLSGRTIGWYFRRLFILLSASGMLGGCATFPGWLSSDGPSRQQVQEEQSASDRHGIQLVDVDDAVARKLLANGRRSLFSEVFAARPQTDYVVGPGDILVVSIWEAPPALLFGSIALGVVSGSGTTLPSPQQATTVPEQMVQSDGTITIPFVGPLDVAGHDPRWIEEEIVRHLKGRANQPQALVQVTRNATSTVTIVGEVNTNMRMPLTAQGEHLLDAFATAGGSKQPVNKTTLQITRGDRVAALPLETIVRDPKQNIPLQPGDVITALYQPMSFMVLGATVKNDEVSFEAQGISLAQALARVGGLDNVRADARAVFIFRFEDKTALDWSAPPTTTPDGKVPVIYQLNLRDPAALFVAQTFPIRNKDVLYVSNAPSAELQKFMNLVVSTLYPAVAAKTLNIVQ